MVRGHKKWPPNVAVRLAPNKNLLRPNTTPSYRGARRPDALGVGDWVSRNEHLTFSNYKSTRRAGDDESIIIIIIIMGSTPKIGTP